MRNSLHLPQPPGHLVVLPQRLRATPRVEDRSDLVLPNMLVRSPSFALCFCSFLPLISTPKPHRPHTLAAQNSNIPPTYAARPRPQACLCFYSLIFSFASLPSEWLLLPLICCHRHSCRLFFCLDLLFIWRCYPSDSGQRLEWRIARIWCCPTT